MTRETVDVPLCVDLDGTLIQSDLLLETFFLLLKRSPMYLFLVPFWLARGKPVLKAEVAKRITLNPRALPYNRAFLLWLQRQREAGRGLWLCTASNYRLAHVVAEHLQIFQGVVASSDQVNLAGRTKAIELVERFGEHAFDYCGNHRVDLAIWRHSRGAVVVNGSERLMRRVGALCEIKAIFPGLRSRLRPALRALRPHQWAKNVLVFVPLATAHRVIDLPSLHSALLAFSAFSLCASSAYLLNDLLDLEADRQHPRKKRRPLAAGELSLFAGCALVPLLLLGAAFVAASLPPTFGAALAGYYLLTLAYSLRLKRIVLIDVIVLAGLYTVRIAAGANAIDVPLSFWLLLFSVFMFLSLALVKRYAELKALLQQGEPRSLGRGYRASDLALLESLGAASGYLCVLVLALYVNSPAVEALYRHPQVIWFLCVLVLYWVSRLWLTAHRGKMHDDPVLFALKDRVSLTIGVLTVITVFVAV
jgi:4-hydroxybenzoate polyprenyltransferase